jgi:hypothetical protein
VPANSNRARAAQGGDRRAPDRGALQAGAPGSIKVLWRGGRLVGGYAAPAVRTWNENRGPAGKQEAPVPCKRLLLPEMHPMKAVDSCIPAIVMLARWWDRGA